MPSERRKRPGQRLTAVVILLLILAAMLPFSAYLAGLFGGGGRLPEPAADSEGPRERGALRVTVRRPADRAPVAGATIVVRGLAGGEASATSDENGTAVVRGLGQGPVRIEAAAGGDSDSTWADPGIEAAVELAPRPPPTRVGRVVDGDGAPVVADVTLLTAGGAEIAKARTDARGRYELPDDPRGVSVCALPEQGAPAVAETGEIVIAGGEERRGRLLGVAGGRLDIYAFVPREEQDVRLPLRCSWPVGEDGSFNGRLPAGSRAFAIFDGRPVRLREGDIELPAAARMRGSVVDGRGDPVEGAVLSFRALLDADFPVPLPELRVEATAEGTFDAAGFSQVAYTVVASAPGRATRRIERVEAGAEPVEIRLDAGHALEGVVLDGRGLPLGNVAVSAQALPDERSEWPLAETTTDGAGRFRLEGLGGTSSRIRVIAAGHHPTTIDRPHGPRPVRVLLQKR